MQKPITYTFITVLFSFVKVYIPTIENLFLVKNSNIESKFKLY